MEYPTWSDVSVPEDLLNSLKKISGVTLDYLVHQMVFRNKRRTIHRYTCYTCRKSFEPNRASEEISACSDCNGTKLTAYPDFRFLKPPNIAFSNKMLETTIHKMEDNFAYYFNKEPTNIFDCGWEDGKSYCIFKGGEKAYSLNPRLSVLKASILCPYLWNNRFDWNEKKGNNTKNVNHLSPILNMMIIK